jgi:branched-subunit amino acid transport protein
VSVTSAEAWGLVVAIAVATFAFRFSFIHLFGRVESVPPRVETALRYVPAAVLAALAVPSVLYFEPTVGATLADGRLVAGLVAALVAWRTESIAATVAVGMATLWAIRFLG